MSCPSCPSPTTRRVLTTAEELDALPHFSVGAIAASGIPVGKAPDGQWYVVGYTPGYTSEDILATDGPVIVLSEGQVRA